MTKRKETRNVDRERGRPKSQDEAMGFRKVTRRGVRARGQEKRGTAAKGRNRQSHQLRFGQSKSQVTTRTET